MNELFSPEAWARCIKNARPANIFFPATGSHRIPDSDRAVIGARRNHRCAGFRLAVEHASNLGFDAQSLRPR